MRNNVSHWSGLIAHRSPDLGILIGTCSLVLRPFEMRRKSLVHTMLCCPRNLRESDTIYSYTIIYNEKSFSERQFSYIVL